MKCIITVFVIVCSVASHAQRSSPLTDVARLRYELLQTEKALWEQIQDPRWQEVTEDEDGGPDLEAARIISSFCSSLENTFPYRRSPERDPQDESWMWAKLNSERSGVEKLFESFRRFLAKPPPPGRPWEDLAETVLQDPSHSVRQSLDNIHRLVMHSNFYAHSLSAYKQGVNSQLCSLQQSPQQVIYNMYNTITLTEIKGYTMMQFSWMLLKIYGKGNFTRESSLMREKFQERSSLTLAAVKSALIEASREIWRCDPQEHVEGETYVALTRLLQGYVENEVDMNSANTCRENCAYYSLAKNYGCFKEQFCSRQPPCKGKILNCRYIDSDMWICPAARDSERRYEWIEYENGKVLGKKGSGRCAIGTSKVDSWWRWLFWHCSYCLCVCDQPGPSSHRVFSLREVLALSSNKVVTGIRFTKVNKVIHLQISEGTLLPRGKIDTASVRWKPVEAFNPANYSLKQGVDYHTMSYEERSIDLDDLEGPEGHLLTGVRFRKVGSHLNFEIRVTPFNFTTGKLISPADKSMWISNDNTDAAASQPRTQLYLLRPDIPTHSSASSVPDSHSDQYVDFTHSDLEADAGQSTVPFLDAQPAAPLLPVPLSGAGLYHKGLPNYGGFVAPKVFTYDVTRHLEPVFPPPQEEIKLNERFQSSPKLALDDFAN